MWEATFDVSMLGEGKNVVIRCPTEELAKDLFDIFIENGIGKNWHLKDETNWRHHRENTAYYCIGKLLYYGPKRSAEDPGSSYYGYTKCTFYGVDTPDFDTASDDELMGFLGIGGS